MACDNSVVEWHSSGHNHSSSVLIGQRRTRRGRAAGLGIDKTRPRGVDKMHRVLDRTGETIEERTSGHGGEESS